MPLLPSAVFTERFAEEPVAAHVLDRAEVALALQQQAQVAANDVAVGKPGSHRQGRIDAREHRFYSVEIVPHKGHTGNHIVNRLWPQVVLVLLGVLCSIAPFECGAGDLRPYLGAQGAVVSGSLDISNGNSNATFTSDHPRAWGGAFAGIEYRFGTSFALAVEADFSAGSIKIAEGRFGAASANAKIERVWTISFLPSVYLDDHWRLFLRAGAGRLNGTGTASDGLGTTVSTDRGFSAAKVGLGLQRDFDAGLFVRAEYFYLVTKREDFVRPAASGLQISVGYAF